MTRETPVDTNTTVTSDDQPAERQPADRSIRLDDPDLLVRAGQHIGYLEELARQATKIDADPHHKLQAQATGASKWISAQQEASARYAIALATVAMARDVREILDHLRAGRAG